MNHGVKVWEAAGMNRAEYCVLPWPEKKKLIIRYAGLPIIPIENWYPKPIPEKYERGEFGRLLFTYIQDQEIQKYPCSKLGDHHASNKR